MKALSLLQPWASLIAIGAKRVETRSWSTPYRGPIAIHASKGFKSDARYLCWDDPFRSVLAQAELVDFEGYSDLEPDSAERFALPLGAIVATARLAHVFLTGDSLNYRNHTRTVRGPNGLTYDMTSQEYAFGNYEPGRFGWVLTDVRLVDPIPCKGSLGLWPVPPDVAAQLGEASL